LLVEDDPALRTLMVRALKENGFSVQAAAAGAEMWTVFDNGPVDCILLDIMLPGTNGYDLCRALRQRTNAPIIFVSAKGSETDRVVGLELGADDFIPKPRGSARRRAARYASTAGR
jgi:two-component system, OmpR family, response regulator